jgi:hypothetical protein
MSQCARAERGKTLQECLFGEALRLIRQATNPSSEALLSRLVSQLEEASQVARWLASRELRPPT